MDSAIDRAIVAKIPIVVNVRIAWIIPQKCSERRRGAPACAPAKKS
jgi:hypothetical protein